MMYFIKHELIFPPYCFACSEDIIKEQSKELRGTQRQITRDRAALEKQEKQMVRIHTHIHGYIIRNRSISM